MVVGDAEVQGLTTPRAVLTRIWLLPLLVFECVGRNDDGKADKQV